MGTQRPLTTVRTLDLHALAGRERNPASIPLSVEDYTALLALADGAVTAMIHLPGHEERADLLHRLSQQLDPHEREIARTLGTLAHRQIGLGVRTPPPGDAF